MFIVTPRAYTELNSDKPIFILVILRFIAVSKGLQTILRNVP